MGQETKLYALSKNLGKQVIIFAKHVLDSFASVAMTNPITNAFFLGRATAEILSEEIEHGVTNLMSSAGRFDAEQRERLRNLTQTIMERAETEASSASQTRPVPAATVNDMQEIIDELRAEIAQLRAALQTYRQEKGV